MKTHKMDVHKILDRLKRAMDIRHDRDLSIALGYSKNAVSQAKTREKISGSMWKAIIEVCFANALNFQEIITGEPSILSSPVLRVIRYDDIPNNLSPDDHHAIPILPGEAAAGLAGMVEGGVKHAEDWAVIHTCRVKGMKNLIAVEVSGGSMHPLIPDGSLVAIHRNDPAVSNPREILPHRVYAFRIRHGGSWITTIKRAEIREPFIILLADNPEAIEHRQIIIDMTQVHKPVIGQVVWVWKELT